jgi:UDP-GlcNAc:undecaprenyl-phosphate GlcNAc-1-phosphate transferase
MIDFEMLQIESRLTLFLTFCLASLVSFLASPLCIRVSKKFGVLDLPIESHKTHKLPIPYLGGVGVYFSSLGTFLAVLMVANEIQRLYEFDLLAIVFGLGAITILGLIDDLRMLGASFRLIIQNFIAIFIAIGLLVEGLINVEIFPMTLLNLLISIIFIVAMSNFVNMSDNHDGSAAGVATISLGLIALLAYNESQSIVSLLAFSIFGATAGFLIWNFPPAKIYLGDSGSTFLGALIGLLLVQLQWKNLSPIESSISSLFIVGFWLLDFVVVVFSRLRRGISPMRGDKAHVAHRLLRLGFTRTQTTVTIWAISTWFALHALIVSIAEPQFVNLLYVSGLVTFAFLSLYFLKLPDE